MDVIPSEKPGKTEKEILELEVLRLQKKKVEEEYEAATERKHLYLTQQQFESTIGSAHLVLLQERIHTERLHHEDIVAARAKRVDWKDRHITRKTAEE